MTYLEAQEKQLGLCKEQPHKLHFIMGKNDNFDVFSGWDGRDEAVKNGYKIPKYSLSRGEYTTNCDYDYYREDWCN